LAGLSIPDGVAMNLSETFDKFDDDYIKFELIENKLSSRPDLHAFILLNQLVPGNRDMVSAAEHDEIYLDVSIDDLAEVITEQQVQELVRCGVRYDDGLDCLCMFV
jgi:hypothetical protein